MILILAFSSENLRDIIGTLKKKIASGEEVESLQPFLNWKKELSVRYKFFLFEEASETCTPRPNPIKYYRPGVATVCKVQITYAEYFRRNALNFSVLFGKMNVFF